MSQPNIFYPVPATTFEAGKSYRMKRGGTVRLERPIDKNGWTGVCDDGDRIVFYDVSGDDGLLPGAIEDETPKPIEIDKSQIAEREHRSDLRQIHSRINRQAERMEERLADQTKHNVELYQSIAELETRCTNLGHKADGAHTRIGAVEREADKRLDDTVTELVKRIEGLEKAAEAMPGPYAMGQLKDRIAELENYTGLDVRSAHSEYRDGPRKATVVDSAAWTGRPTPPKPTIKGGWVNVYRDSTHAFIGTLCESKDEADMLCGPRIACIQIPDITEGEGL